MRGRACGGHGNGGTVAPETVLGSHQQRCPRTPGALLWGTAVMDRVSTWCVPLLAVAMEVVLPILPCRLAYEVCLADGNGGIR